MKKNGNIFSKEGLMYNDRWLNVSPEWKRKLRGKAPPAWS